MQTTSNPNPAYVAAEIEIVPVDSADIICTSGILEQETPGVDATW